jgi:hypothetical protein
MKPFALFGLAVAVVIGLSATAASIAQTPSTNPDAAQFDDQGRFLPPANYRDWVFLSSGVDMSYSEAAAANPERHSFTNTFAPRAAVDAFKRDGKWPDKTVLALEVRGGASNGSINKRGVFQSGAAQGVEFHVKDEARFKGGWAFYGPSGGKPATMIPTAAACYACHQDHAAADTTFVQFYPTLFPVAEKLSTLSAKYLAEEKR